MRAKLVIFLFLTAACANKPATLPLPRPALAVPQEAELMSWNGPFSSVEEFQARVVKTQDEWESLWRDIGAPEAPIVDLQVHVGVAVFLGLRNTGGYSVKLLDSRVRDGKVVVPYRESAPRGITFQALTYPYAVRLYPKTGAEIVVEAENASR